MSLKSIVCLLAWFVMAECVPAFVYPYGSVCMCVLKMQLWPLVSQSQLSFLAISKQILWRGKKGVVGWRRYRQSQISAFQRNLPLVSQWSSPVCRVRISHSPSLATAAPLMTYTKKKICCLPSQYCKHAHSHQVDMWVCVCVCVGGCVCVCYLVWTLLSTKAQ